MKNERSSVFTSILRGAWLGIEWTRRIVLNLLFVAIVVGLSALLIAPKGLTTSSPACSSTSQHPGSISSATTATTPTRRGPSDARGWARMFRRIYEVDPLLCECGETMRILSFLTDSLAVDKILHHLASRPPQRAPPRRAAP